MEQNVGGMDRIIRVAAGIILLIIAAISLINNILWLGVITVLIGVVLVITAILGFCPLYLLFKINTKK
jgi:hypothetical protein